MKRDWLWVAIGLLVAVAAVGLFRKYGPSPIERVAGVAITEEDPKHLAEIAQRYASSDDLYDQAFSQAYQAYSEFMTVRQAPAVSDPRATQEQLQAIKGRILAAKSQVKAEGESGLKWSRFNAKISVMIADILKFEQEKFGAPSAAASATPGAMPAPQGSSNPVAAPSPMATPSK